MNRSNLLCAVCGCLVTIYGSPSQAVSIIDSPTGLNSPTAVIDFGANTYTTATVITDQYMDQGVFFGDGYVYGTTTANQINFSGGVLTGWVPYPQPGSIYFVNDVESVAFAWVTNPGRTTFSAYHNGVLVESFTSATNTVDVAVNYFGFKDIKLDEIRFSIDAANLDFGIDNIQFVSSVPAPATIWLFGSGLLGLIGIVRRKNTT